MNAVGVDVGGTKIAAGVVSPEGEVLAAVRYPTPRSPDKLVETMVRAINEVGSGKDVAGVCLAVPGFVLAQKDTVVFSPNLPAIEGIPLKERVGPEVGFPLTIENDASAAAWGEFRFGSGSGVDDLVFLTLGTGIGGGVISHRALLRGAQGSGGELGHVTVHATGPRCACGNRGCLEALASGTAIGRRAREAAVENPGSALGRLAARRGLLGEDVTELAREGDGVALSVLEETGRWLGIGLAGFVNVFNPEVVAVGGGAMEAGDLILASARREIRLRARPPSRDLVEVKEATLGPESGVLGAAALARNTDGAYALGG
ncbi:ROK family protein [Rubrobacter tropicus]|uniref:ROK family protein n=1 Tax=Rubrobacter tropicus TaxID=2653851 RepID=A0A6G8Q7F9_9ACTN|nr:ROK family protein [Rubrobacter tropicus]QIN82382.1 ROK family protein [Rubrobacter tropicus]